MGSVVLPHLVTGEFPSSPALLSLIKTNHSLTNLRLTGWHVDQAIMSEEERLVIIRFGRDWDPDCMRQDEVLYRKEAHLLLCMTHLLTLKIGIADRVKNFAVIYVCDLDQVPDFKQMYGK